MPGSNAAMPTVAHSPHSINLESVIRIGTAGWQYPDWAGIVYLKPKPRGFDELSFIASLFNTVEINSSFYGPPRPTAAKAWVDRVAGRPDFRFTAKLLKGFTHARSATDEDERLFKEGIGPPDRSRPSRRSPGPVPVVLPK
jgi:uncharacterized protein YecE (DUF72 family)